MKFEYKHVIELFDEDVKVTSLGYTLKDNIMSINSVNTDEAYRNQGLARKIVDEAVRFAKENNYKIIPICPYVIHLFDNGGFEDVDAR